jgi:hypothetical protein
VGFGSHFSKIMPNSHQRGFEYHLLHTLASEPIKLVITFELPKDCLDFYGAFASVFFPFFAMEQRSGFVFECVESMIDFYASVAWLCGTSHKEHSSHLWA